MTEEDEGNDREQTREGLCGGAGKATKGKTEKKGWTGDLKMARTIN